MLGRYCSRIRGAELLKHGMFFCRRNQDVASVLTTLLQAVTYNLNIISPGNRVDQVIE